jgi:hypothetical protein
MIVGYFSFLYIYLDFFLDCIRDQVRNNLSPVKNTEQKRLTKEENFNKEFK